MISKLIDLIENQPSEELRPVLEKTSSTEYYHLLTAALEKFDDGLMLKSRVHGISHVERVSFLGMVLANEMNLSKEDAELFLTACVYHDIGRTKEFVESGHGLRAANIVNKYVDFQQENLEILKAAIEAHSENDRKMNEILDKYNIDDKERARFIARLLKDADALDRVRISDLNPSYLRYGESKKLVGVAGDLFSFYR